MNRTELLTRIHTERERLDAALARVDEARMTDTALYGAWSVKDMLAHIGWWEQRAAYIVDTVTSGRTPEGMVEGATVDQVNARVYHENHARSLEDVRRSEREAYETLLALTEKTGEDDLFDPQRFAWTKGQPLADWVVYNTYDHYAEHLAELQAWLERMTQK